MKKKQNTIRLTESQFNALLENAVIQALNEGFGDYAKKIGKGIGKAALYGALGAGALNAIDSGLENQEKYQQELNKQARELQGPSDEEVEEWISDHGLKSNPQTQDLAFDYLTGAKNESKMPNRLSQIIREEISKVL